jgi:polyribonucleotide nucleotidyltransferase
MSKQTVTIPFGEQEITLETGQIGRQANGAVLVRSGETYVFNTACASKDPLLGVDFLPLTVVYQEKFSSAGKTLGGFIKREGRPSQKETLISRLIDRPLRPMFEEGYYHDTQVLSYVWSFDKLNSPEPLAIVGASAALMISDIPLKRPVAAVRVEHINGKFRINAPLTLEKSSRMDLIIAGTEEGVLMIEGYCDFMTKEEVLEAIHLGHNEIKNICKALSEWGAKIGKPKIKDTFLLTPQEVIDAVSTLAKTDLDLALRNVDKKERGAAVSAVKERIIAALCSKESEKPFAEDDVKKAFKYLSSKILREIIVNEKKRLDNRAFDEIRPITIEKDFLPRAHGSALFTRGETQTLAVCTLGGETMAQKYEHLQETGSERFYLQYFFPPFSVGEVGRIGAAGRREVGHGKLAEKALSYSLPSEKDFPYTMRVESNITECNGSSSMATVCGCCLALMSAGVPIKRPVAGIAMGLILEKNKYTILSDILGDEDALGDMDFKITGGEEGITPKIMEDALNQADKGLAHILGIMKKSFPQSNELSDRAPRIVTIQIDVNKIGTVIGPGGKMIRKIVEETGVQMDINDDGVVSIVSDDAHSVRKAEQMVKSLVEEAEIGKIYAGTITSVVDFGAFVEILPGKEGLCHISEFDIARIADMRDVAKEGDQISVKVLDVDPRTKKIRLSRRATLESSTKQ